MIAHFFRQTPKGPQAIGTIRMTEGRLVADPPDAPALRMALDEPVRRYEDDGQVVLLDAKLHPEAFLEALPKQYHGTYLWAELR